MKDYKVVIFDWDGTLMDSIARIVSSMQSAAKIEGLAIPSDVEVKEIIGLSLPVAFEKLFSGITDKQVEAMLVQYKHQFIEADTTPMPLFDNAANLLTQLKQQSKVLAIATGKGREGLNHVLKVSGMAQYFDTIRCAGEMPSKPNPEMLNSILAELDVLPHEAIMIGDTSHDLEMALAANIDSVGVTFGVHDSNRLSQYNPKYTVDSLAELQAILV